MLLGIVQEGEGVAAQVLAAREARRDVAPETADVRINAERTTFVDATHAAVWFSISVEGRTLLSEHRGDAVIVDGSWKMARSTFCRLMGMAGVPCPPSD